MQSKASTDDQVIALWLHGRLAETQCARCWEFGELIAFVRKPREKVTLSDLPAFADSRAHPAPTTQPRTLNAIPSLLRFAQRIGYLTFDLGAAVRPPPAKNKLAERILPETAVQLLSARERNCRNRVLLRLIYGEGLRVSEICGLMWKNVQERGDAVQHTVYGKRGKARVVLLSATTWRELVTLHGGGGVDQPIFRSRKQGGHLDPAQVRRIVGAAAAPVGITANVSPHCLRHAHASHALDRGCPIHLVRATLGHASDATTGRYLHARPTDSSARYLAV